MTLDEADALSGSLDAGDETFVDLPTVNGPISQGYQSSSHSEHHQRVRCSTVLSITVIKTVLERSS
ncbi:hypothetical protein [uncultured Jatrophihabitans sp.]|uniref:hypothetical protein n=1 Tax=uncultured Jatrophihabitans sp. TaxID=1610747 RepID=UPI0035CC2068